MAKSKIGLVSRVFPGGKYPFFWTEKGKELWRSLKSGKEIHLDIQKELDESPETFLLRNHGISVDGKSHSDLMHELQKGSVEHLKEVDEGMRADDADARESLVDRVSSSESITEGD